MSNGRGVGSPPGYYVFWLLEALKGEFMLKYEYTNCRCKHNYRFARYRKRTLIDEFIIIRTSKKCYRVMYFNADYNYFTYFTESNYTSCSEHMKKIYFIFKALEQKFDEKLIESAFSEKKE